jgi:hypothetical protein
MAWIKVPPEHHPLFRAALPKDPRVETLQMFGGVAAKINGHLFAGLFGRSTMVLLSDADRTAALALDGAELFDPMGDGRVRSDKVMLPEDVFHEPAELRRWIARAFEFTATLPRKTKASASKASASKASASKASASKASASKASASKASATRPATKQSAAKAPATKRAATARAHRPR